MARESTVSRSPAGATASLPSTSTSREPLVIVNNIIEDNGVETPAYYEYGGGIHSEYSSLVIANNVIRGNRSGRGGGIAALGRGYARIEMNHIERNTALGDHGGGVYVQQPLLLRGNIVRSNAVTARIVNWMGGVGGGITIVAAAASLSDNLVTDNYAKKCGGGVFVDEGATATLSHEKVIGNQPVDPKGWGGSGIYVDGGANAVTDVHIVDSVILENAPGGPGIGNGIFAASRARVTVDGFRHPDSRGESRCGHCRRHRHLLRHGVGSGLGRPGDCAGTAVTVWPVQHRSSRQLLSALQITSVARGTRSSPRASTTCSRTRLA